MAEPLRAELSELVRLISTHVAWQRDLGLVAFERNAPAPLPESNPPERAPERAPEVQSNESLDEKNILSEKIQVPVLPSVVAGSNDEAALQQGSNPKVVRLEQLRAEVAGCQRCALAFKRTQTVFARGSADARLVFVGEGPGEQEDRLGRPFVGPAGQLLDKVIAAMGLTPDEVYIANVVKCRPPGNRAPIEPEMQACAAFLIEQLGCVNPEVIVALGKTATGFLLRSPVALTTLRGRWHSYEGVAVMPTWHPSYVLRNEGNRNDTSRRELWNDMKLVLERLGLEVPKSRSR